MKGQFDDTIIFMMGCGGLKTTEMADAFIKKGASVYVGWNTELVVINEMDIAIIQLLQHFIREKITLEESIRLVFNNVDSNYSKQLTYYPLDAGGLAIGRKVSSTP